MRLLLKRRKSRGNLLGMAMAMMCVLVVIAIAMHTSQARASRSVTQSTAELQFRQAAEFKVADLLFGGSPAPSHLRVTADENLVADKQMPTAYADKLYANNLPNWNVDDPAATDQAPGHKTYQIKPKTSNSALQVFANNFQWMVCHDSGGYAAYAPNGTIELGEAVGWANPNFLDSRASNEAFSGVPFLIGAKGKIKVDSMPYGEAHSTDGPFEMPSSSTDLAVAYQGPLPLRAYQDELRNQINAARSTLEGVAASCNKTNDISGNVLDGAVGFFNLMTSGDVGSLNISLQQAMGFPFPMIPGFSATIPGIFFEFWFHMPDPPDFYEKEKPDDGTGKSDGQKVKDLDDAIKKLEAEIADLQSQKNSEPDEDKKKEIQDKIDTKQGELDTKRKELEDLKKSIEDNAAKSTQKIKNNSSPQDPPDTRRQDKEIPVPKTGLKGWAYGALLGNMLDLLTSVISGDLEGIGAVFMKPVRLVHFGGRDNIPEFDFSDGFFCDATFTVPRGRPFRYNGKMEIDGDLWLQKGSVMHVTGDLVLSNPNVGSSNPLDPCGKLVIEEGATLIVGGDLECNGSATYGSMWVCSPPMRIAPITTAIFVGGTASFPNGSFSSTNIEDAFRAMGGMDGVADAMEVLFTDVAPNLAKIVGPFHTRMPYFASYATTFQLTIVPTPIGPIPVPTPIPLPKKNILIPVFRSLTMVYAGNLNVALGENLYTHADWWAFGEGTVPAMIKFNPAASVSSLKSFNIDVGDLSFDWEDYVGNLAETIIKGAVEYAVQEVGKKLVTSILSSAIGGSLTGIVLDEIFDAVGLKTDAFETFKEEVIDATLGPFTSKLEALRDQIEDEIDAVINDSYVREVGGPLIYANSISVGDSRLMSGMMVAESAITMEAKVFVGSVTCLGGNILAAESKCYFTPVFTRASLYRPKTTSGSSFERVVQVEYGKNFNSNQAVDISTGVWQVTTEGWSR